EKSSMRAYIVRRLLLIIPTLLGVSLVIFFVVQLVPGDIIDAMQQVPDIELDRAVLERQLGLDASLPVQYGRWMGFIPERDGNFSGVFQGNLGESFLQKMSVVELVAIAWPVTFQLGLMAIVVAQLIALPIGTYSALRQDTWGDYIGRSFAILAIAVPGFWLGTLIMVFPAIWWDYMPPMMLIHFTEDPIGNLQMFIVPVIILG
ncbi:unnamed protein product, partial [marine sediment metagenome]